MISIEKVGDYNTCCVSPLGAFNYNLLPWYEAARGMASKAQFEAQKGYIEALKYAKKYGPVRSPSASDVYARLERGRTRTEAGIRKIFDVNQPERAQAEILQAQRAIPSTGVEIAPIITTATIQTTPTRTIQSSIIYIPAAEPAIKMLDTRTPEDFARLAKERAMQEGIQKAQAIVRAERERQAREIQAQKDAAGRAAYARKQVEEERQRMIKVEEDRRAGLIYSKPERVFVPSRMSPDDYARARAAQAKARQY
jgi:hypothetical protein